jgi:hypothetical protein
MCCTVVYIIFHRKDSGDDDGELERGLGVSEGDQKEQWHMVLDF